MEEDILRTLSKNVDAEKQPHTILIADDSEDNRSMYSEYLVFAGYSVLQATNGFEAVSIATAMKPDLILMDLSMPELDGWQATRELKRNKATRSIKIVALTGHAFSEMESRVIDAGCDRYVAKPCLPHEVAEIVAELLSSK